ncbi:hypothetical protein ACWGJT_20415, partial [Streptomyces xantholiticus]
SFFFFCQGARVRGAAPASAPGPGARRPARFVTGRLLLRPKDAAADDARQELRRGKRIRNVRITGSLAAGHVWSSDGVEAGDAIGNLVEQDVDPYDPLIGQVVHHDQSRRPSKRWTPP